MQRFLLISLLLIACITLTAATRRFSIQRAAADPVRITEVLLLPPGRILRQIDLGYHSLMADLLFIKANIYYGEKMYADQETPWLPGFIKSLMEIDPDFKTTYLWGALVTTFYKREINDMPKEIIERANKILEAGMQRFPDDYRFPMRLAFNFYYELGDADTALPYFEQASQTPGAPSWLREKLIDIYTNTGRRELARRTLSDMLSGTEDPSLVRALRYRMQVLLSKEETQDLLGKQQSLISEWKERYQYLTFELYLLIREP